MLNCCIIEPARRSDCGSTGAFLVANAARKAGHNVDAINYDSDATDYDVEMLSIHHSSDYPRLLKTKKHGKIRIIGGHITYNNPRPVIPYADYICMGDGEEWIKEALAQIEGTGKISLPKSIDSSQWINGSELPERNYLAKLEPTAYLNRAGTRSAAWYIETARGCVFNCEYCELGNSMPYRFANTEKIKQVIDNLDKSKAKKIVFFAPDEASHKDYNELLDYAKKAGFRQRFGAYRLDQVIKKGGMPVELNQLVKIGIDGLTEKTRFRVGKKITNSQIFDFFKIMVESGHISFKCFQMIAHPWEKLEDFDEWENLMNRVVRIPTKKNIFLRIKWTPLIPQPCTPLSGVTPVYDFEMAERIHIWHQEMKLPRSEPGWFLGFDGLMSKKNHKQQIAATVGDESFLS